MVVYFHKYQGTGNDFIMIDDRREVFDMEAHQVIRKLCDRKFGIGADGLILIRNHQKTDFEMVYFNADGHQTSLCGNGSRCAVQFARQLGMVDTKCTFQTIEGILNGWTASDQIIINMPDVNGVEKFDDEYFLNTGSPHHIRIVENLEQYDVFNEGKSIRNSKRYQASGGTNANFIEASNKDSIFVRTFERGVEDETFSCGTGVTAAAIVYGDLTGRTKVNVKTLGGDLSVMFDNNGNHNFTNVCLKGPADYVFKGEIDLNIIQD